MLCYKAKAYVTTGIAGRLFTYIKNRLTIADLTLFLITLYGAILLHVNYKIKLIKKFKIELIKYYQLLKQYMKLLMND